MTAVFLHAGLCTVMENMVKTFDDVTYSMPEMPTACETILARDCSSMGLWMVTVTSVTPTMKMVRMLVPRFEFKLMPSSSFSDMTLYINGVPKTLTSRQSLTLPDTTIRFVRIDCFDYLFNFIVLLR